MKNWFKAVVCDEFDEKKLKVFFFFFQSDLHLQRMWAGWLWGRGGAGIQFPPDM